MASKEAIINSLSTWSLMWDGELFGYGIFSPKTAKLSKEEVKEVRKAIIDMVKQNPSEWRIEEWWEFHNSKKPTYLLLHQNSRSGRNEWGELHVEKLDPGKIHFKGGGLTEEEWKELEQIISTAKQNTEQESKSGKYIEYSLYIIGAVAIVCLIWLGIKKLIK